MKYYHEQGEPVRFDDGFDQLIADVIEHNDNGVTVKFTKGNRRHLKGSIEEVPAAFVFPMETEQQLYACLD